MFLIGIEKMLELECGSRCIKFVKVGESYRFMPTDVYENAGLSHADMVKLDELDNVMSAGELQRSNGQWRVSLDQSFSLKRLGVKRYFVDKRSNQELMIMLSDPINNSL